MRLLFEWRLPILAWAGLILALFGLGLGLAALFAAPLGLGIHADFLLFRKFGWPRRETLYLGASICVAAGGVLVLAKAGPSDRNGWRRFAASSGLLVTSTVVALLMAEIIVRTMDDIPLWPIENRLATQQVLLRTHTNNEYHPILSWVLKPNIKSGSGDETFTTGEFGVRMHKPEISPVRKGAILAVGDSFTAGSEVTDSQSWPAHLERMLGEPVINAGTGGWGADQIVLRAEQMIPLVAPKMVIVSFYQDDIARAGERVHGGANKPWFSLENGRLVHHNNPVPKFSGRRDEIGAPLLGYSYLVTWLMDRTGQGEWWRSINISYVRAENDPEAASCALLKRLKAKTDERGIDLLFMLQYGGGDQLPSTRQVDKTEAVARCARDAGVEVLDLWQPLLDVHAEGVTELKKLFVMHNENRVYGHMSGEGNRFVARYIVERMKAMQLLD